MTRLYRTDQELNSSTKVRQSHVLYSRFEPHPVRRVSTPDTVRLARDAKQGLPPPVEIEALEPNFFTEFPLG